MLFLSQSDAERLASLASWIRRGLDKGDKVLFAEAPSQAPEPALDRLNAQGVDVGAAVADGRLATMLILAAARPSVDRMLRWLGVDERVGVNLVGGEP